MSKRKPKSALKKDLKMPKLKGGEFPFALRFYGNILAPLIRLTFNVRTTGIENLPKRGAYVLAGNHVTNLDALAVAYLVYVQLRRAPHFLAKEGLFRTPVIGAILRAAGQIPVYRSGRRNDEPLRAAFDFLRAGHSIAIFPEGTLTRDPDYWPMRGKPGAVRLALEAGVPVYPFGQWGTEQVMGQYTSGFKPGFWKPVNIVIGKEVDLAEYRDRPLSQADLAGATAKVMREITVLVEQVRGEPAPDRVWDPAAEGQPITGNFKKVEEQK